MRKPSKEVDRECVIRLKRVNNESRSRVGKRKRMSKMRLLVVNALNAAF
jgi:hypothetical protein